MTHTTIPKLWKWAAAVAMTCAAAAQAQPQPHPHPSQLPSGPGRGPAPGMHAPGPAAPKPPVAAPQRPPAAAPHMQHGHPPVAAPAGPRPGQMQQAHRGAGPDHRWQRGSKVPAQFRTKHYVVNDWKRHGLKAPARGQQWVQYGSDYLLVSIASGVIAQLVLGH